MILMITINHERCILCRGCSSVCPVGAIEVGENQMKTYPKKCIDCGLCVKKCPVKAISQQKS